MIVLTPALIGERDCCAPALFLPVKREKYLSLLECGVECNDNDVQSVEDTVIRNSQNGILKVLHTVDSVHCIDAVLPHTVDSARHIDAVLPHTMLSTHHIDALLPHTVDSAHHIDAVLPHTLESAHQ
jgi:hypothetical protein